jgi:hypothetical protein
MRRKVVISSGKELARRQAVAEKDMDRKRVQALHLAGLDVERALEHLRSGRQDLATEMVESAVRRLRDLGVLTGDPS